MAEVSPGKVVVASIGVPDQACQWTLSGQCLGLCEREFYDAKVDKKVSAWCVQLLCLNKLDTGSDEWVTRDIRLESREQGGFLADKKGQAVTLPVNLRVGKNGQLYVSFVANRR